METQAERQQNKVLEFLKQKKRAIIPVAGLIVVVLFFHIVSGGKVIAPANFSTLFNETFTIMMVSCALIFVMAQGKMDMSIASTAAVAAAVGAYASEVSVYLVLPAALLTGALIGLLNGLIVTELRIDSFIATIAMSFIMKGAVELLLMDGVRAIPIRMMLLDTVELKLAVVVIFAIICFILFDYTAFGKQCRAIGSRAEVARQSGVKVKKIQYLSYVFTGAAAGAVAFFFLLRSGAANIGTASNLEFNALQALMLGGMVITGGSSVRFRSAIIGSITMAVFGNGMTLWGVETLTQQLIKGVIFLAVIALTFDRRSAETIK